jgi:hypothetical protein
MIRASKIAAFAIFLLLAILFFLFVIDSKPPAQPEEVETLAAEELALMREGDFVLRLGYGMVSFLLEKQTGSVGVSHIGILAKDSADFYVIHSISGSMAEKDGVQKASLGNFLYEARPKSFVATRLKNGDGAAIAGEARRLLAKQIPFDLSFNIKDTTKLFCSSLINLVLKNTHNIAVFSEEEKEFPFGVFFDTARFEVVVDRR